MEHNERDNKDLLNEDLLLEELRKVDLKLFIEFKSKPAIEKIKKAKRLLWIAFGIMLLLPILPIVKGSNSISIILSTYVLIISIINFVYPKILDLVENNSNNYDPLYKKIALQLYLQNLVYIYLSKDINNETKRKIYDLIHKINDIEHLNLHYKETDFWHNKKSA
ncbi:hypothetical protein [Geobacillus thermodenitrificans]|uniref:Uncharacterized protein n=1 Tax=Geobacillus thermodenitrificans (strain NG80-2) TaxID=420246 RepID=A4IS74_GEOTN|nr:hypothetical protein [Geobacillus thermodenitrificans]ABO68178.1 hypothetical protein GTNG_2833 [Geobacillus thermodenitrificans NG80-2]